MLDKEKTEIFRGKNVESSAKTSNKKWGAVLRKKRAIKDFIFGIN